ncbi:hypothetical protein MTO96_037181 [Rhipicephalus appendiculatus]
MHRQILRPSTQPFDTSHRLKNGRTRRQAVRPSRQLLVTNHRLKNARKKRRLRRRNPKKVSKSVLKTAHKAETNEGYEPYGNISRFSIEEKEDKENTRVARTPEEQQGPKDSWEDPSDDKEHRGEEDSQQQQKLTDDYPPLQQDEKQQEKPSLLTKLARSDRAIMKALTKITTATAHMMKWRH